MTLADPGGRWPTRWPGAGAYGLALVLVIASLGLCRTFFPAMGDEAPFLFLVPPVLVASSRRIREELGWTPRYPELETIIAHAWAWRQVHPDGYR